MNFGSLFEKKCCHLFICFVLLPVNAIHALAQTSCHCHELKAGQYYVNGLPVIAQVPQPAPPIKRMSRDPAQAGSAPDSQHRPQGMVDPLRAGTQSTYMEGSAKGTTIQAQVEQEAGPVNILFLIDSSQSMKEGLGGVPKMEAAKQVLQNAISNIPGDINLGLRVFGQRFTGDPMVDCSATQLLVPLAPAIVAQLLSRSGN